MMYAKSKLESKSRLPYSTVCLLVQTMELDIGDTDTPVFRYSMTIFSEKNTEFSGVHNQLKLL